MRMTALTSLCVALFWASSALSAPDEAPVDLILLQAGELLAVPGEGPVRERTIVIAGARIVDVRAGFIGREDLDLQAGQTATVIDLRQLFVLPGLMDAHVHLMWSGQDRPPKKADEMGNEDLTLWTLRNARAMLGAGFTTVRELASQPDVMFAVRDWINAGKFLGPRILAAGLPVTAHGGHGDATSVDVDLGDPSASGLCSGRESCRRAVRMQHKRGADLIKMMSTGGFFDNTGIDQFFFFDEMQATVEAAHQLDMPVATHAYAGDAIADAVRAGVDSVDHGFGADDSTLRLMKQKGIYLVPTLSIAQRKDSDTRRLREEFRAFERAVKIGTPVAFGTDVGGIPHQFAAREFGYMVAAGMSPAAAIEAATVNTSRLFRIAEDVGTLEIGKLADVIAVDGNPLENIGVLEDVRFVMKSGRVAKRDGVLADIFLE